MKKILIALAALVMVAGVAQAQSIKTQVIGPLKWQSKIGSAVSADTAYANAIFGGLGVPTDTTAWFDLGQHKMAYIGTAVDTVLYMPLKFCFDGSRIYTDTDSLGTVLALVDSTTIIVQACNRPGGVVTTVVARTMGGDDCIEALTFSGRQLGLRYWRALYWHTYTAVPVQRKVRGYAQIQTHE